MKSKILIEIIVSVLLIFVLLFYLHPLNIMIPHSMHLFMIPVVVVLFVIFVGVFLQEHPSDEREQFHRFIASRCAYFAAVLVLLVGIITQSLHHTIDPWLIIAIGIMLLAKSVGIMWSYFKYYRKEVRNMNKSTMWILVLIALLVGAFGGYYFEKNKATSQMMMLQQVMQKQANDAKMMNNVTPTETMMSETTMMSHGVLTDSKGMTLYVFDKDTQNTSNCYGTCATLWPPFVVNGTVPASLPAHMSTTKRTDGVMQYTYNGSPLYYYAKDTKARDTNGDGFAGLWHVIK